MIVARIYVGHVIRWGGEDYEVVGTVQLRGRYSYTVRDKRGVRSSMRREAVMDAQKSGAAVVVAA